MANYQETVYATDSMTVDLYSGDQARGAQLQGLVKFNFANQYTEIEADEARSIYVSFPDYKYPKKKLTSVKTGVFVISKNRSYSGGPGTGEYVFGVSHRSDDSPSETKYHGWENFVPAYDQSRVQIAWDDIEEGRFNEFSPQNLDQGSTGAGIMPRVGYSEGIVSGVTYIADAYLTIASHASVNTPYQIREYQDVVPYADSLSPAAGTTINGANNNAFSWKFKYDSEGMYFWAKLVQDHARLLWRRRNDTEFHEYLIQGEAQSYTVPASTFDSAVIEWQVIVTSDDNVSSAPTAWIAVNVENPLVVAQNLSPKGVAINGGQTNIFSWQTPYVSDTEQTQYEAQYSADNGLSWQLLSSGFGNQKSFVVPSGTFATGTIRWRIRCYNKRNIVGPWSDEAVVVVENPLAPPIITSVTNKPRPHITWISSGQQAFQVRIGDYDSSEVYGTAQEWQTPEYLPSGPVQVRVRVANVFGVWSEWAVKDTVIENVEGPAILVKTRKVSNGAELSWDTEGQYVRYYIYRDGIAIGKTTGKVYTDYLSIGKHVYMVRGVDSQDYYTDSRQVYEITLVKDAAIADVANFDWLELHFRRGGIPEHNGEQEWPAQIVHYDGRRKPVAEVSEFEDCTHDISFSLERREDYKKLLALGGHTVIFKDCYGALVIGYLGQCSDSSNWGYDVSFTITETDYIEEIEYD